MTNMEIIEIRGAKYQLDVEQATALGVLKEKPNRPMSWEEYKENSLHICGFNRYVASDYNVSTASYAYFATEDEARAFCALGKLIQLRDAWWDGWRPNLTSKENGTYTICNRKNEICIGFIWDYNSILMFPTEQMRNEFLDTFRGLIEEAKMFL